MVERQTEAELRYLLERCNEELQALVGIGKALTSCLDLQEILNLIMATVSSLLKPGAWSLLMIDEDTEELVFEIAVSPAAEQLKKLRLKKGQGIAGWVALHGQPLLIPNVSEDARFAPQIDQVTAFTTHSIVCVPVQSKSRILGVIQIINSLEEGTFVENDMNILSTIADYAAIAIDNARYFRRIHELVITDDLTGLFNSRYFHELLDQEVERAQRFHSELSLVFIDLDYFKTVNDTHGHLVGSALLTEVGHLIAKNIRKVDSAARYGGDEFVIILPSTSKSGAIIMVSNLRQALRSHCFITGDGHKIRITASYGIATFPDDADSKNELVRMADKAMYEVKETTRDNIKFY
jgi:diguanylate cyclase (GGDEF)-like protein